MFIRVFVDDCASAYDYDDTNEYNEFKLLFMKRFKTSDLGNLDWILGMKIYRDRKNGTLFLSQKIYVEKVLSTFQMNDCKPVSTAENTDIKLSQYTLYTDIVNNPFRQIYQCIVGSLLYAAISIYTS